jgi:hypothetical protein
VTAAVGGTQGALVSACLARDYPLFSRGRFMRTAKDRDRLAVCAGSTLRAARETFGYHTLQARQL